MTHQFGQFGGQYVPEPVIGGALNEVEAALQEALADPSFKEEYLYYLKEYVGRPSPLFFLPKTLLSDLVVQRST